MDNMVALFSFAVKASRMISSCHTNLHTHQQCIKVFSLQPHQYLLFSVFLITAILTEVR